MAQEKYDDALRAVRLYYLEDLTMEAIAAELHTSRSTVSRLLSFARERGLIEFRLHSPQDAPPRLEGEIADRFGIEAHVVPNVGRDVTELQVLETVARYAARMFNGLFGSDMTLGLAWGTTTTVISRHLVAKRTDNSLVVQMNGAGNNRSNGIEYASEGLRRFGEAFGATVEQFPVPTFFDAPGTRDVLWRERSVKRVLDLQRSADIVLFGIGALGGRVPSHVYSAGYLEADEIRHLSDDGIVADVATMFIREDGTWRDIELNQRSSGPDLGALASVDQRVCVVSGRHRLPGLRAALAAGLVTHLVVDEETGAALVAGRR